MLKALLIGLAAIIVVMMGATQWPHHTEGRYVSYTLRASTPPGQYSNRYDDPRFGIDERNFVYHDKPRTYQYFAPKSAVSKPLPLIVLLHGSGRSGAAMIDKWRDLARQENILLVAPNAMDKAGWGSADDGPDFLHAVIDDLGRSYKVDSSRTYLFGHSSGAIWALRMGVADANSFAAVAVHAGSWRGLDLGAAYAAFTADRPIPIAIFAGTHDAFFPMRDVRGTAGALGRGGLPVTLYELPDHTHWYYDIAGFINRNAWLFLQSHTLAAPVAP